MAQIIKNGFNVFYITCPKCQCEFIYRLDELNAFDNIDCPYCHKPINHDMGSPWAQTSIEDLNRVENVLYSNNK